MTDWEPDTLHPNEVEVCADCLTASCLTGAVPCDKAGTDSTIRTVAELRQLALESPDSYALHRL